MTNKIELPRLLIIDDDEMIALILAEVCANSYFQVKHALNGKEGVELFKSWHPDIVLLDVLMPEMDGFECLTKLRQMPNADLLPIIMLTGIDDLASIYKAFNLGATDFIVKPIDWTTLKYRLEYMYRSASGLIKLADSLNEAQKIAHLGSWQWDVLTNRLDFSEEFYHVMDLDEEHRKKNLTKKTIFSRLAIEDAKKLNQLINMTQHTKRSFKIECPLVYRDGVEHIILCNAIPKEDQAGNLIAIRGTVQDITEFRRFEEKIQFLSDYDTLTGLYNRNTFQKVLSKNMLFCKRSEKKIAVLFIGFDKFKRINETLGPAAGDMILKMLAKRTLVPSLDKNVFKLAGDGFGVILNSISDHHVAEHVAKQWLTDLRMPFLIDGNEIFMSISIGIVIFPNDGNEVDEIIKNGEIAMHHAKLQGGNRYQFFSDSLNEYAVNQLKLECQLQRAIERSQLVVFYQAKVDIQTGKTLGMEALIRWKHPELGLVSPQVFICLAEESGLIQSIGEWVLKTVCLQQMAWKTLGFPAIPVSVNISSIQFDDPNFANNLILTLQETKLPPEYLILEITESAMMHDVQKALNILKVLKNVGVKISIDDFGTGYSSLSYLIEFPIDELKIDRSFIAHMCENESSAVITSAILALGNALKLQVVAEGVETQVQADFLLDHGCHIAQGYLYSKPIPADQFFKFVMNREQNILLAPNDNNQTGLNNKNSQDMG